MLPGLLIRGMHDIPFFALCGDDQKKLELLFDIIDAIGRFRLSHVDLLFSLEM